MSSKNEMILILDFGSQVTQLITRRLRDLGFYSEIHAYDFSLSEIQKLKPQGIILSGGPNSVYESGSPTRNDLQKLSEIAPLLGICYGMQLITHTLGGVVEKATHREYGLNNVTYSESFSASLPKQQKVWMSHGDVVVKAPPGLVINGLSETGHAASLKGERIWAVQFHPEVAHTEMGSEFLKSFCIDQCRMQPNWNSQIISEQLKAKVKALVPENEHVLCALSGGVDSSVVAVLLTQVLGPERVHCVFVDTGMLRKNEFQQVQEVYQKFGLNVLGVNAEEKFLTALKDISEPEQKRKLIGRLFIEVFEESFQKLKSPVQWLAQGTLYPDVIESVSSKGGSHTIKSHHNVGGLPERMKLKLLEPVRDLFKDEVRKLGLELGLPPHMIDRHPFPGPGLAIRIMGSVDKASLDILREADAIYIQFLRERNLYHKIWQAFCVLLPVKTVGVQGDGRTYEKVLALRAVTSQDGMTADWYPFSFEDLREVSNRITNQVKGVNRVVYDVTSKPPGTIEWE